MALPQERGGPFVWDAGVRREEGNVSAQTHKRDPAALVLGFFLSFLRGFFPGPWRSVSLPATRLFSLLASYRLID